MSNSEVKREPQHTLYTYTWQAWQGEKRLWEESNLSALQVLQRGRIESKRVPDVLFRAMAESTMTANGREQRDYVEIWQDGRCVRVGTFAQITIVRDCPICTHPDDECNR